MLVGLFIPGNTIRGIILAQDDSLLDLHGSLLKPIKPTTYSDDLYPVTKPSTTPSDFLATSASTWHQRLGHPGDEVLRSLTSRQFVSCNKEKSSHICHASQLGKQVKLPFHNSDSNVQHCFDIIHFDLWTSHIRKYALQLLERAHMVNCNPSQIPDDTESKLGPDEVSVKDPTLYRSLARGLQYLTFTCPDLSYAGTLDLGLHVYSSSITSLVGYTDADWADCPSTHSTEAEYQGVANVVVETAWLRTLLLLNGIRLVDDYDCEG
uniref:Ribonuclease H-like domain-containing protein n=1 Tax=Tanacetum cinerariifolium TaxID=118510 RepID=A0A6L2MK21_TANCI|nr:ribonuclease H-like domain-containing protein [Tanacetum cinerariifolium]